MTYSSCLHDQQDLCWGNTSRDTIEESQESQENNAGPLFKGLWAGKTVVITFK